MHINAIWSGEERARLASEVVRLETVGMGQTRDGLIEMNQIESVRLKSELF